MGHRSYYHTGWHKALTAQANWWVNFLKSNHLHTVSKSICTITSLGQEVSVTNSSVAIQYFSYHPTKSKCCGCKYCSRNIYFIIVYVQPTSSQQPRFITSYDAWEATITRCTGYAHTYALKGRLFGSRYVVVHGRFKIHSKQCDTAARRDCYKETIFGMLIMTKLQQQPRYSIFSLTQLSSPLTYDIYLLTPLDSTLLHFAI